MTCLVKIGRIALNDDNPQQELAQNFLKRTLEIDDNLQKYRNEIDQEYRDSIKSWEDEPHNPVGMFKLLNRENIKHSTEVKIWLDMEEKIHEALYQGANRFLSPKNGETFDNSDINNLIAPKIGTEDVFEDIKKPSGIGLEEILGQDIDTMIENRQKYKYKNSDETKLLHAMCAKYKDGRLDNIRKEVRSENTESCVFTPVMRDAYLEILSYGELQKAQWKRDNPDKEPQSEKDYEDIRIKDMSEIELSQITFTKNPNGSWTPDKTNPITTDGGKTFHRPQSKDFLRSYIELITIMEAEGKTKFACTSSNPDAIAMFRAAIKICGINPQNASIYEKSRNGDVKLVSSEMPMSTSLKNMRLINTVTKEYNEVQEKAFEKQVELLAEKQKQQQQEQQEQLDHSSNEPESNAPRMGN